MPELDPSKLAHKTERKGISFTQILQCELKNFIPLKFSELLPQNFACLLRVEIYDKLQNIVQLSINFTQLCHIKRNQLTRPVGRRTG